MTETVRGRRCPSDSYPHKIAAYARERARLAREALAGAYAHPAANRQVEALEDFAEYVVALDLYDPRLEALYLIQTIRGNDEVFDPAEQQASVINALGLESPAPPPADVTCELVAAGIEDVHSDFTLRLRRVGSLEMEVAKLEPLRGEVEDLERQLAEVQAELEAARAENAKLGEQFAFLTAQRAAVGQTIAAPPPVKSTEKKAVGPKFPGVYTRQRKDGTTVHVIGWQDADQRQRWRTLDAGTDLEGAMKARDEAVAEALGAAPADA